MPNFEDSSSVSVNRKRETNRETLFKKYCEKERQRERVCVCVCVWVRERERERFTTQIEKVFEKESCSREWTNNNKDIINRVAM